MEEITQFPGQSPETRPGAPARPSEQGRYSPPYQMLPEPKKHTWLWILLGAVILAGLFFALVVYYGSLPEPAGEAETSAGTPEAVAGLEEELQGVNTEGLESELGDIDKELQGL